MLLALGLARSPCASSRSETQSSQIMLEMALQRLYRSANCLATHEIPY